MRVEITEEMRLAFMAHITIRSTGLVCLEEALQAGIEKGLESGAIKPSPFFHGLTPEQLEALALISEEAGEAIQAAMKIVRHGMYSRHPVSMACNKQSLEKELGDLQAVVKLACDSQVLDQESIDTTASRKPGRMARFLHHLKIKV